MTTKKKLGQILLEAGVIDEYQLKSALGFQKKWGGRLGNVLVENRFITEDVLIQAIQEQTGIAAVQLDDRNIPDYLTKLVPQELAEKHHLIPISLEGEAGKPSETLIVATSDPTNLTALDELRFKTGKRIRPVVAGEKDVERAIAVHYRGEAADGLDFDIDPEGIQFGGPEMEADSLDSELVVVQGTLESSPADPVAENDPFAELASLGAPPPAEAVPAPAAPATPPPAVVDDPFAEIDALVGSVDQAPVEDPGGDAHPAATDLDFDLDAPDQGAGDPDLDILEDIEIIDNVEQIDPAPAPAGAPAGADPSPFGDPDSDLAALGGQLEAMPDLGRPADLSGVPDLEPADPTPVMPAPGPPAAQGLDNLPDLEPAGAAEPLPTVQGQQVAPSPFAEEESPDEATADLLLDGEDLDLDAVLAPISDQAPIAPPGTGVPEAAERTKPDSAPTQIIPAGVERPKPDSVPTQVLSLADMQPPPDGQAAPSATPEQAEAEAAPAPSPSAAAPVSGSPGGETEGQPSDPTPPAAEGGEQEAPGPEDGAVPEAEAAPGVGTEPEENVKSDAMKALLSRVGLSKEQPAGAAGTKKTRPSESRAAADPAGGDPTLAALIRLMVKKGLISAEELEGELDGD